MKSVSIGVFKMLKALHLRCTLQNPSFSVGKCLSSTNRQRRRIGHSAIRYDAPVEPVKLAYFSHDKMMSDPAIPPVLIMHGFFSSKESWRSVSEAIHSKTNPVRKVITLDARNHGDSPHSSYNRYIDLAEDVHLFCKEHKIPKVVIMGHSMGGRAMMVFALEYPHLVEKAIIVDISPVTLPKHSKGLGKVLDVIRNFKFPDNIGLPDVRTVADEQIKIFFSDKATRDSILMNLYETDDGTIKWRMNVDALENNLANMAGFPEPNEFRMEQQHRIPILFVGASKTDYLTGPNELTRIRKIFPQADLKFLNTGHSVHLEASNEFVDLATNFINS